MTACPTCRLTALSFLTLFAACVADSRELPSGVGMRLTADQDPADAPRFSDWSAPVNVGPPVNTAFAELNPFISKDGLSLYFDCNNCPGIIGGFDIFVAQRASVNDPWGPPQNLGTTINTASNELGPNLSPDGHRLYFFSTRPGGFGAQDLYVARRHDKRDDFGWEPPVNLGGGVNTSFGEVGPAVFEDDETGAFTLYFQSNRPRPGAQCGASDQPACDSDIYASTRLPDGTFGPAVPVEELNTPFRDETPGIRGDGLEIFLASSRPGSLGVGLQVLDLWVATRASTSEPWSAPVSVGPVVNSEFIDQSPALSSDGTALYFHSAFRPGNVSPQFDIWVATRSKLKDPD